MKLTNDWDQDRDGLLQDLVCCFIIAFVQMEEGHVTVTRITRGLNTGCASCLHFSPAR